MCCSSLPGPFDLYYQLTQMIFSFISWDNLSIGESEVLKASTIIVLGTIMLLLIVFLLQNREQLRYYCDIIVIYIYLFIYTYIYAYVCVCVCV
jgi:ACR3 family arsenite efflux pump ArsB